MTVLGIELCVYLQKDTAEELHQKTGLSLCAPVSFNEIHLFESAIDTQIVVFGSIRYNKPMYVGEARDKRIYLYYTEPHGEGHFDAIVNITGCLGVVNFCHSCLVGFNKSHR